MANIHDYVAPTVAGKECNVMLPAALHRKLKTHAARNGQKLKFVLANAVQDFLRKPVK